MRPRFLAAILVAACVPLAFFAFADAPPDQYNTFTKDGQEIFDVHTQLRWARYKVFPVSSVAQAEATCAGAKFSDGGVTGWRVPTIKELLTIVDEEPHQEALADGAVVQIAIDKNAFPGTPVDRSYVATATAGMPPGAWVVDFSTGIAKLEPASGSYWVRCVRAE